MKAENNVTNIFLAGVGGQGAILARNILSEVFINAGYDVKKSEVHGMAQRGGQIILNKQQILPPAVASGRAEYPKTIEKTFKDYFKENVHIVNGQYIAKALGNVQAASVVLVGAFSRFFPRLKEDKWIEAAKKLLAPKLHDLNLIAFGAGRMAL